MKNKERLIGLLIGIVLTVGVVVIYGWNGFEGLELQSYDLRFSLRGPRPLSNQIVLVTIDEESLKKLGTTLREFRRSLLADAIERLSFSGAQLIGMDLVLANPSSRSEDDRQLRDALAHAGNVILPRFISSEMAVPPWEFFREVEMGEGMINVALDSDGVLRRMPVLSLALLQGDPDPYLTFSLEVSRLFIDPDGSDELDIGQTDHIQIGSLIVPTPDNKLLINFYGPPETFPRLPIWRVVSGDFSPDVVRGKIVLIGSHNPTGHDLYRTPFSGGVQKVLASWGEEAELLRLDRMYGVEIHANAIQTVLDKAFIHRTSSGTTVMIIALLGLVSAATLLLVRQIFWMTMVFVLLTALIPLIGIILFVEKNIWLDIVPLMATVMANYVGGVAYQRYVEGQQKKRIIYLFGRYVSPQVTERLIQDPSLLYLKGTKKRLTILFSDIRGFTSMSEKLDAAEVALLLNEYFKEMTHLIFEHNGTLDKFMGDAIMAFFGDPVPYPDHALRAVKVAIAMRDATERLNQKWMAEGRRTIGVGIGINTGMVTVGNLGSEDFMDYTVIGDEVNLSCRLEENAKSGQVLISQNTYNEVKDEVEVRPLDPISLKGKSQPVAVYEVLGLTPLNLS